MGLMKCFYEQCMSCEVISERIFIWKKWELTPEHLYLSVDMVLGLCHIWFSHGNKEWGIDLTKDFTAEEVRTALWQMHPTKAPRPDGMSTSFYQKFWDIVGYDVTNMVLNVLNSNASLYEIVLI